MKKIQLFALALAGLVITSAAAPVAPAPAGFAVSVVSYNPGTGYVAGFTNVSAALGEPSQINPYGEATDVFDPPYGPNQILSIGAGGSLTVKFKQLVFNDPRNPFGLDFIIFGNTGFIITNDFDPDTFTWVGTPATDGSTFGENDGETRVSVSADGKHFYVLNPALAPTVDGPGTTPFAFGDPEGQAVGIRSDLELATSDDIGFPQNLRAFRALVRAGVKLLTLPGSTTLKPFAVLTTAAQ